MNQTFKAFLTGKLVLNSIRTWFAMAIYNLLPMVVNFRGSAETDPDNPESAEAHGHSNVVLEGAQNA